MKFSKHRSIKACRKRLISKIVKGQLCWELKAIPEGKAEDAEDKGLAEHRLCIKGGKIYELFMNTVFKSSTATPNKQTNKHRVMV